MKKKNKIILLIVGIFLTISLMIGLSYAYYIFSVSQNGTNVVRSDCFEITYDDVNAINLSDTISLTDEEAYELTPYHFTIKNVCNTVMEYDVNIETLNTSTMNLNAIAVKLDNRKKKILGSITNNDSSIIVNNNTSSSKTIYNNILKPNEEKSFNLRIWVDENATVEQSANKSYSSKVVINTKMLSNYSEADLISGTEFNTAISQLATNFSNITSIQKSLTAPLESDNAIDISSNSSEKPVYAWFDDGTIYIYSEANIIFLNEDSSTMFRYTGRIQIDFTIFDTSKVTNMSYMFANGGLKVDMDLSEFDTSNVTDMSYMFYYGGSTNNLDLSNFNTSKVENMTNMFSWSSIRNINLSGFDTSSVTDMSHMFEWCSSLKNLDLSSFDTSNVENMFYMFYGLNNLETLDISSFYTPNVTNMGSMFHGLYKVTSLDLSHFDTSNVTNMLGMFDLLYSITSLDISSFNTSKVENMSYMFNSMINLKTIYVGDNWSTSSVTNSTKMFNDCRSLVGSSSTAYDVNHTDGEYARVDDPTNSKPGYFTLKTT